jgi:hypothetical protein
MNILAEKNQYPKRNTITKYGINMVFKAGQAANPYGRPKLPEHLRAIKALGVDEFRRYVAMYARMNAKDLQEALARNEISAVEAAIAHQIVKAGAGDPKAFELIYRWALAAPQVSDMEDSGRLAELEGMTQAQLAEYIRARLPPAPAQSLQQSEPEIPPTTTQELSDE